MEDIILNKIDKSDKIHQEDILLAQKGWFKFSPHMGVGIMDFINDQSNSNSLRYKIERNFRADGMRVNEIKFNKEKIHIDAEWVAPINNK